MLNETRVKHMVKLAMYENKEGTEELKTSAFYKKDYISFNMLWSIIWMTIGYIIIAGLCLLANLNMIMETLSMKMLIMIVLTAVASYAVLLIIYLAVSHRFYKKKHHRAYYHVKKFKEGLTILEDMYQEEKTNG